MGQQVGLGVGGSAERGDEIILSGSERRITEFSFGYNGLGLSSDATIQVRFYNNEGATGEPGDVLYDSGQAGGLFNGINDFVLSNLNVVVPDIFTWTIFYDQNVFGSNSAVNNIVYDPVSIGASENYFWIHNTDSSWQNVNFPGSPDNFRASVTAVPIPPVFFLFSSGLLGLIVIAKRRKA